MWLSVIVPVLGTINTKMNMTWFALGQLTVFMWLSVIVPVLGTINTKMNMTWFALGQLTVFREWALRLVTAEVLPSAMRSQWNKQ